MFIQLKIYRRGTIENGTTDLLKGMKSDNLEEEEEEEEEERESEQNRLPVCLSEMREQKIRIVRSLSRLSGTGPPPCLSRERQ